MMSMLVACGSEATGNEDVRRDVCVELVAARHRYFEQVRESSSLMIAAAGLVQDMTAIQDKALGTDLETPARIAVAGGLRDVDDKSLAFVRECVRLGLLDADAVNTP